MQDTEVVESNGHVPDEWRDDSSLSEILDEFSPSSGYYGDGIDFYTPRLGKQQLEEIYRDWLGRRIATAYAIEATRKWTKIKLGIDDDEKATKIIQDFQEYESRKDFNLPKLFRQADSWSKLYGAAVIVMGVDDGRPADEPVDTKNIKSVSFGKVLDRYRIMPDLSFNTDPEDVTHYRFVFDNITQNKLSKLKMADGRRFTQYRIHKERCLVFEAYSNPVDILLRNPDGWSDSLLGSVWSDMERYLDVNEAVSSMLKEHYVLLYQMEGYKQALKQIKGEGKAQIRANFRNMVRMMRLFKAVVFDKNDSITNLVKQYAGVADLMDRFANRLVAATDIPYTQLFGRGPQGLAAQGTGQSEDNTWEKKVSGYQEMNYRPLLNTAYDYILLAKDGPTQGKIPDGWSYGFVSLEVKNMQTEASVRSQIASADNIYQTMGAITKDEIRNSRFGGSEYSIDINLDNEEWEKLKKQEEEAMQAQQQQQYGGQGFDPYAQPEPDYSQYTQDSLNAIARRKFNPGRKALPFAKLWVDSVMEENNDR